MIPQPVPGKNANQVGVSARIRGLAAKTFLLTHINAKEKKDFLPSYIETIGCLSRARYEFSILLPAQRQQKEELIDIYSSKDHFIPLLTGKLTGYHKFYLFFAPKIIILK